MAKKKGVWSDWMVCPITGKEVHLTNEQQSEMGKILRKLAKWRPGPTKVSQARDVIGLAQAKDLGISNLPDDAELLMSHRGQGAVIWQQKQIDAWLGRKSQEIH